MRQIARVRLQGSKLVIYSLLSLKQFISAFDFTADKYMFWRGKKKVLIRKNMEKIIWICICVVKRRVWLVLLLKVE